MSCPKLGEPITSVIRTSETFLCFGVVTDYSSNVDSSGDFHWMPLPNQPVCSIHGDKPSDEGREWIRGHHDENTPAGAALLAANALMRGT